MADKKAYPLRISTVVLDAMQRWADDDLRSVNAQIEFVLRDALRKHGRLKPGQIAPVADDEDNDSNA
ncbi:MAG TPA: Arc family DNA binding domain-containing protein [Dyella sp.]|uniref:Arc family DNA binding domain-containing protein n=1 Tax=Dyella sp. TaxID=1869338 RepID=UPI002F931E04